MNDLLQDLRYALRSFARTPGFTLASVLTLALGVGATTTVFSVADAVVLDRLPYPESDALVFVQERAPQGIGYSTSEPTFLDWQDRATRIAGLAAMSGRGFTIRTATEPQAVSGLAVSASIFDVLGVELLQGRSFTSGEDRPGGTGVVMLGASLWERAFGADPGVVGTTITVDDEPRTVVGVFDDSDAFLLDQDLLVPLAADPFGNRNNHMLQVVGRLASGSTPEDAAEEMDRVAARIAEEHPASNGGWGSVVTPLRQILLGEDIRTPVYVLLGAVALVLLIACVNVSNLLVARGAARLPEIGLRTALGADRSRLTRLLLTESLVLAALGVFLGLMFTSLALPVVRAVAPAGVPRIDEVRLDGTVLAFALACVGATTLLFGVVPTLRLTRRSASETLREGSRGTGTGGRLRDGLVVAELSLATAVLVGSGLLMNSFVRLTSVDPGFDTEGLLAIRVRLPFEDATAKAAHLREVEQAIAALPGVSTTGSTFVEPFTGFGTGNRIAALDRSPQVPEDFTFVAWRSVTPGYFETIGLPLLSGEIFRPGSLGFEEQLEAGEGTGPDPAPEQGFTGVVISESLAAVEFPDVSPIGRQLRWSRLDGPISVVLGVVSDARDTNLQGLGPPVVYRLFDDRVWDDMSVLFRAGGDRARTVDAVRATVRRLDPGAPMPEVRVITENMAASVETPRFLMRLFGAFAVLALVLGSTGVYGLLSFQVAERRREIGVRLALGARPRGVLGMVVRQGMTRVSLGLLGGVVGALYLGRFMAGMLYEVEPSDPATLIGVTLLLAVVSLVATILPAYRAGRLDPTIAFRGE